MNVQVPVKGWTKASLKKHFKEMGFHPTHIKQMEGAGLFDWMKKALEVGKRTIGVFKKGKDWYDNNKEGIGKVVSAGKQVVDVVRKATPVVRGAIDAIKNKDIGALGMSGQQLRQLYRDNEQQFREAGITATQVAQSAREAVNGMRGGAIPANPKGRAGRPAPYVSPAEMIHDTQQEAPAVMSRVKGAKGRGVPTGGKLLTGGGFANGWTNLLKQTKAKKGFKTLKETIAYVKANNLYTGAKKGGSLPNKYSRTDYKSPFGDFIKYAY